MILGQKGMATGAKPELEFNHDMITCYVTTYLLAYLDFLGSWFWLLSSWLVVIITRSRFLLHSWRCGAFFFLPFVLASVVFVFLFLFL